MKKPFDITEQDKKRILHLHLEEKQNLTDNIEKLKITISKEVRLKNLKEIMTVYAS